MTHPIRAFCLLWLIILAGCHSAPETKPDTTLTVTISAGPDLNQTRQDSAAPLQVRLYELQSPELFERADFLDIYLNDASTLQDSLIKKHTLPTVQPNSQTTLSFTLDNTTRHIAVFAEFARFQSAVASAVHPVLQQSGNPITLHINGNHLRISDSEDKKNSTAGEAEHGS